MVIYAPSSRQASRPVLDTPSAKHRAGFAREATLDAFGRKAAHTLEEPDFEDRQPDPGPRALGRVAAKVADDTGMKALRHWLNQAGRADSGEEREAALEIAGEIASLMGLDADLTGRRATR